MLVGVDDYNILINYDTIIKSTIEESIILIKQGIKDIKFKELKAVPHHLKFFYLLGEGIEITSIADLKEILKDSIKNKRLN